MSRQCCGQHGTREYARAKVHVRLQTERSASRRTLRECLTRRRCPPEGGHYDVIWDYAWSGETGGARSGGCAAVSALAARKSWTWKNPVRAAEVIVGIAVCGSGRKGRDKWQIAQWPGSASSDAGAPMPWPFASCTRGRANALSASWVESAWGSASAASDSSRTGATVDARVRNHFSISSRR